MSFTKNKEREDILNKLEDDKNARRDTYVQLLKEKLLIDDKKLPQPIVQNFETFDRIKFRAQNQSLNAKRIIKGFGGSSRFEKDEISKWKDKIEKYNLFSDNKINALIDPTPGPQAYSLVSTWVPNKKSIKEKENTLNYFKIVSKKPSSSTYHSKI